MKHIFIATPVYSHTAPGYTVALAHSMPALTAAGYSVSYLQKVGCPYIHKARNWLVRAFLASRADDLLFLDSDVEWRADDLLRLVKHETDVVGGAIPYRAATVGYPVVALKNDDGSLKRGEGGLVEAAILPTAVLKIKRSVFYMIEERGYAPLRIEDDMQTQNEDYRYSSFFDFEVDQELKKEYGEDITFCRKCSRVGIKLWIEPNMTLRHFGNSFAEGNFAESMLKYEREQAA